MFTSTDPTAAAVRSSHRAPSLQAARRDDPVSGHAPLDLARLYPALYVAAGAVEAPQAAAARLVVGLIVRAYATLRNATAL